MRSALVIIAVVVVAVAAYLVLRPAHLSGTQGTSAAQTAMPQQQPVSFSVITSGDSSTVNSRKNYLITSQDELSQLWRLIGTADQPPAIDFSKEAVIAVFAGNEPTAGYSIAVTGVKDSSVDRTVSVTLTSPSGSCVLAQHVTAPYQLIELPATALTLSHQDSATTTSCL